MAKIKANGITLTNNYAVQLYFTEGTYTCC
jgi:hypothetical protein